MRNSERMTAPRMREQVRRGLAQDPCQRGTPDPAWCPCPSAGRSARRRAGIVQPARCASSWPHTPDTSRGNRATGRARVGRTVEHQSIRALRDGALPCGTRWSTEVRPAVEHAGPDRARGGRTRGGTTRHQWRPPLVRTRDGHDACRGTVALGNAPRDGIGEWDAVAGSGHVTETCPVTAWRKRERGGINDARCDPRSP